MSVESFAELVNRLLLVRTYVNTNRLRIHSYVLLSNTAKCPVIPSTRRTLICRNVYRKSDCSPFRRGISDGC